MSKHNTKKQQVTDIKNKAAVEKASNLQLTESLNSLSTAGVKVQETLSQVGKDLIAKASELNAVDEAIVLKKKELEDLHGKDKILLTIDELKTDHEKTINELKIAFSEEKARLDKERLEESERRVREQKDYEYEIDRLRKKDAVDWEEQLRVRLRDETIRREQFDKNHAEREAVLKQKELDYATALDKLKSFDLEVEKRVKEEVSKAAAFINKEHSHSVTLTAVQHKAEADGLRASCATLATQNSTLTATVQDLQVKLQAAYEKNGELASKAVESAANKAAHADALALITNIGGGNGTTRPRG